MPGGESSNGGEDRVSTIWNLLPSFDPTSDDPREYRDKVRFLHSICPSKDKSMLAPRLAMACKGTAWSQVKQIEASKLTDPEQGVEVLLTALSSWDEAAELQTYERFEKAIYKVMQKNDESTMSFVNRLAVAFHELGDKVTVKELQAFILLRQSSLTSEDKRKLITLSGGTMEVAKIEQSMRTLSTKILTTGSEIKKRVYPANYVEAEDADEAFFAEDGPDEEGLFTQLAEEGDEDALFVSEYEGQILDYIQEMPEMAECFSAYTAARARLRDKARSRGSWPSKGRGKQKGSKGKSSPKGGPGFRRSLAERIATSSCRACGKVGHWKWECPARGQQAPSSSQDVSNVAMQTEDDQNLPELMAEIPQNTVTLEEAMRKLRDGDPAPAFIRVHSTLMTDRHEDLVDPHMGCANFVHDMIPPQNSLVMLCRKWGKLRDRSAEEARVLTASLDDNQVRCAILDTGASRTVIGKAFAQQFASQLAPGIRERIRTGKSQTVFRFGNNGVLPSVFAMFVPLNKGWFRVEVVEGKTPFLLSNAFLRKIGGVLDFEQGVLRIPRWQRQVELVLDRKGLYKVDMVRLLDGLECQQSDRESESESIWHAPTTDDRPNVTAAASDLDLACANSPSSPEPEQHGPFHRSRSRQPPGQNLTISYTMDEVSRPEGINSLREWGNYVSQEGKHKDKTFLEIFQQDRDYGKFIKNRRLTSKSLQSYRSFHIAMENAIHREKNKSPITAPIIQDPTEMIHHMTPAMPMSAGKMADTEKHSKTRRFQSQDQLPHRPGDQSKGSSSSKRSTSWDLVATEEVQVPMGKDLTPDRELEIRTQMAILQRELDNAKGSK